MKLKTLVIFAISITIVSCKKEYSCKCKTITTERTYAPNNYPSVYITESHSNAVSSKEKKQDFKEKTNCYTSSSVKIENYDNYSVETFTERTCTLK